MKLNITRVRDKEK